MQISMQRIYYYHLIPLLYLGYATALYSKSVGSGAKVITAKGNSGLSDAVKSEAFLPEKECCVPALDSSDVPPIAKIPSFLLMAFRKLFAMSLLFSS